MKTIVVKDFYAGMAQDIYDGGAGKFSIAKHFDILTYPGRLQPLRGMTADTTGTKIGNIIVASDGLMYGVGENAANTGKGKLWQRSGYGVSDVWQAIPVATQVSSANLSYPFLVEWKGSGSAKYIFWADVSNFIASDPAGGSSITNHAITFTSIGQGLVHPKDQLLYIPYKTSSATCIALVVSNSTPFTGMTEVAFSIPSQYTVPCLSFYGNYLAIPGYSTSSVLGSIVYLSDRDTSLTTFAESINWGSGQLKVLNNLQGALIGISTLSAAPNGSVQDYDAIQIKEYIGGSEPTLVFEFQANHLASSSGPIVSINPRVNFVSKNRLYFSVNINPNDGISNSYYGLFSVGKNKKTGRYTVNLERVATNDNSETGVIAAAIVGDFASMVHTTEGTLTCSINGLTSNTTYAATSVYESVVNPEMSEQDAIMNKKLQAVAVHTLPLMAGQQVVMKYRIDSNDKADWKTCFTKTFTTPDAKKTVYESVKASSANFTDGRNYEFRLESTGGAVITGFAYKYEVLKTNL